MCFQAPKLEDVQLTSLLSAYNARNLTTYLANQQQVWTPGAGGSADAMTSFTVHVQLRIPEELVRYVVSERCFSTIDSVVLF